MGEKATQRGMNNLGDNLFYQSEETLAEEEAKKPKQHTQPCDRKENGKAEELERSCIFSSLSLRCRPSFCLAFFPQKNDLPNQISKTSFTTVHA
jgi:hypothetical protein